MFGIKEKHRKPAKNKDKLLWELAHFAGVVRLSFWQLPKVVCHKRYKRPRFSSTIHLIKCLAWSSIWQGSHLNANLRGSLSKTLSRSFTGCSRKSLTLFPKRFAKFPNLLYSFYIRMFSIVCFLFLSCAYQSSQLFQEDMSKLRLSKERLILSFAPKTWCPSNFLNHQMQPAGATWKVLHIAEESRRALSWKI